MATALRQAKWDPARVLDALGSIGYSPPAAILDIVDNSVSYGGTDVEVDVQTWREDREGPGRRRTLVSAVSVTDNGDGMDEAGLEAALMLGSPSAGYDDQSLSKFGMGLKSASSSLGRRLEVTSRGSDGRVRTAILDHDVIVEQGDYVLEIRAATEEEAAFLDRIANGETGTSVRVSKIHQDNLPSPAEVLRSLKEQAGVIYFYRLTGTGYAAVNIQINEEPVRPFDPLSEEHVTGDLDELSWDGLDVTYINRPQPIQLTEDGAVTATVTMTQLPHPPSASRASETPAVRIRERYMIGAGNYGFYIYRNGRLISWADSLGMVSQDQDLYSFRGRLEIHSDADDILNLNVAKSRIELSDIARDQLTPLLTEGLKKSKRAWGTAGERLKRLVDVSPHEEINEELNRIGELDERDDELDEDASPKDEQERLRKRRKEITKGRPASEDESKQLQDSGARVQYVESLDNNQLWERAHDPQYGLIVRVNQSHRLFREIVEAQKEGVFIKAFDLLVYGLARGEYEAVYKSELEPRVVERVMTEYRERVGNTMSEVVRRLDIGRFFSE